MTFSTPVDITPMEEQLVYGDKLLFLGSCFADEIGSLCHSYGFDALVNPFGPLYNPASICQTIQHLNNPTPFSPNDVIPVNDEFYCTFSHNTDFWNSSPSQLLDSVNQHLQFSAQHFAQSKWIVVSLGSSYAYRFLKTNQIVSNCHKLPSQQFSREFLSTEISSSLLSQLVQSFPQKQFIITISPLRHLRDGLHQNQLSKAALLLAADNVCSNYPNAHYFPAYEILLDELRDYRFYKEDMIHPTQQSVNYIWDAFVNFAIQPNQLPILKEVQELRQMMLHKPLFPQSRTYHDFELKKENKINTIIEKYPSVIIDNLNSEHPIQD